MHIVTFMVSLSGFELSSDEDEPSLQPEKGSHCSLLHPPDGSYGTRGPNAYLFIAFCAQEIEEVEQAGHGVYPPARDI